MGFSSERESIYFITEIATQNRMEKYPLKSIKIMAKMDRGAAEWQFDKNNEIAAVHWKVKVVSFLMNFENTRCYSRGRK